MSILNVYVKKEGKTTSGLKWILFLLIYTTLPTKNKLSFVFHSTVDQLQLKNILFLLKRLKVLR